MTDPVFCLIRFHLLAGLPPHTPNSCASSTLLFGGDNGAL